MGGGRRGDRSVGQLLEQHLISSCRIGFSGGSWREKLNKPTHRMESPKQTAEEDTFETSLFLKNLILKLGDTLGFGFVVRSFSTSAEQQWW